MVRYLLPIALFAALTSWHSASASIIQTFNGAGGALTDNGTKIFFLPIHTGNILKSVLNVTLNFSDHTRVGDLQVTLNSPTLAAGIHLFSRVGVDTPSSFGDDSDLSGSYTFVNSGGEDFWAAAAAVNSTSSILPVHNPLRN